MVTANATDVTARPEFLSGEYPFRSNFLALPGARMHYLDEGEGHPVLMLHGNPTWSFYYRNLVKRLRGTFRCLVPDHVGCGLSDKPPAYRYDLKGRIDDVAALVGRLKLDRFDLVVHDWGGAIGMGLALRHPGRVRRLVILNTGAFPSRQIPLRIAVGHLPVLGAFGLQDLNLFLLAARTMATTRPGGLSGEVWRGYLHPYQRVADRIAIRRFVEDIPMERDHPSYGVLRHIEANLPRLADKPALLAWGAQDFCFNLHFFRRFTRYLPDAERIVYDGAGHLVLEDAAPAIELRIAEFLSAPGTGGACGRRSCGRHTPSAPQDPANADDGDGNA